MSQQYARILLVIDEKELIENLTGYLGERNMMVDHVASGEDAIRYCLEKLPHIVLLDVTLPDIDGFEVCSRLRHQPRTAHIPIIFLTNRSRRSDRLAALNLGADDYVTKPFDLKELYLRIRNAVDHVLRENTTDPLTGLPTSSRVYQEVQQAVTDPHLAAMRLELRYADLFRDMYGPLAFSDVRVYITSLVLAAVNRMGSAHDFVGVLNRDTLVLIGPPGRLEAIGRYVLDVFNPGAHKHYAQDDLYGNIIEIDGKKAPVMQIAYHIFGSAHEKATFLPLA